MRKLMIQAKTSEKTGVVTEGDLVCEYILDRPGSVSRTGSVYLGKVTNVHKGMQAAFVDIGEEKAAFLRLETVPWAKENPKSTIKEGDHLFVQVIKDQIGDKGPQVSADITIPGIYAIYRPFGQHISVSRKLDHNQAQTLKQKVGELLEDHEGAILRTAAGGSGEGPVLDEIHGLKQLWSEKTKDNSYVHKVLEDPLIPDQMIRKFPVHTIDEIVVDDVSLIRQIKSRFPALSDKVKWDQKPDYSLDIQDQLLEQQVDIDQGVQLVIETTEAMMVIDVNSHQYKGKAMSNSHALDVNKQAAKAIQHQIRLRNLSGIIIIDFISMRNKKMEQELTAFMKKLMQNDPVGSNVIGMTGLGLMELTRKREWPSASSILSERQAPIFTSETMLYRLERELLALTSSEAVLIRIHPSLFDLKKRLLSSELSSKIPQELFVRKDVSIPDYQIELEGSENMVKEAIERRGYHVDNRF
ncbi:S1 RNA-binding domain-containing protein [Halobacillus fulvus]|nr:S1 RNA-binding domain-containing protein [Halobacillus fulvus]